MMLRMVGLMETDDGEKRKHWGVGGRHLYSDRCQDPRYFWPTPSVVGKVRGCWEGRGGERERRGGEREREKGRGCSAVCMALSLGLC